MLNIDALEHDLEAKRQEGLTLLQSTARTAEEENRAWTDEERAALKKITDEGLELKAKIARLKGDDSVRAELDRLSGGNGSGGAGRSGLMMQRPMTMGEQFVRSKAYDFIKQGGHRSQSSWRTPSVELFDFGRRGLHGIGAPPELLAETLTSDPASGGQLIIPQYLPGILPLPQRRLMVADLMASGTTTSNVISYMAETVFTNAAAPVLEGGVKPESTLQFDAVTDNVRKIAHWLPVTEEMLEDVAQIQSYIDARLRLGVQLAEEDQLLNGSGIAPQILGIMNRPGLGAPIARGAAETNADAIFKQIMALYNAAFLLPDGIVMNPADWQVTVLMKTTTGEYLAGGPFAPVPAATLWGLPVAVTPVIVAATALVGAYMSAAQVFRKGGVRVEASNSHADFFIKNLVAIRAEERLALAVYRAGAFGKVTGLGVPV